MAATLGTRWKSDPRIVSPAIQEHIQPKAAGAIGADKVPFAIQRFPHRAAMMGRNKSQMQYSRNTYKWEN